MVKYRDKKTGRFVSKSKWSRSKAHGGTRYVRQRVAAPTPKPLPEPREEEEILTDEQLEAIEEELEEMEETEYAGAFDSP